jgi:hypothetical protein
VIPREIDLRLDRRGPRRAFTKKKKELGSERAVLTRSSRRGSSRSQDDDRNGKSHTRRDDDLPHININIACSIPPAGRAKIRRYRPREQVARSFLSFVTFDFLDSLLLLDATRRFVFPVRGPSLLRVCLSNV